MRKLLFWGLLAAIFVGAAAPGAWARALNAQDKKAIECAMFKMETLSKFFNVEMPAEQKQTKFPTVCGNLSGKEIRMPEWFPAELERMEKWKIVYIEGEGTLSEATLWYRALANVYSYLDRANDSLDPSKPIVWEQLSRGYVGNRMRLVSNLDHLNRELVRGQNVYNMKDSMQGRARAMLATLELMNREFYSTVEAFTSPAAQKEDKYRQSVMAVVTLANALWNEFYKAPIPMNPPDAKIYQTTRGELLWSRLLLLFGTLLAAGAVYALLENKREEVYTAWDNYRERSNAWAEDFNRQFLTIDVKYIVFGTIAVFAVFGLLIGLAFGGFFGVIAFLGVVLLGAFVAVRIPPVVLENLKRSRGRKINAQLMDSLILLSNSLRSGMDIVQGFELVSHDLRPPISDEFGLVVKNYQLGTPFEKALEGLDDRVESRMLSYTIKAIIIQRQVGGNLTVIFSRLVENIREESKLEEKLEAMTAQQKLQALVVGLMPLVMMGMMFMFRPEEMISFYTSGVGLCVLLFCFIWIMIGMKLIQKLGEVKV